MVGHTGQNLNKNTICLIITENGQPNCPTKLHIHLCEEYAEIILIILMVNTLNSLHYHML